MSLLPQCTQETKHHTKKTAVVSLATGGSSLILTKFSVEKRQIPAENSKQSYEMFLSISLKHLRPESNMML